MSKKEKTKQYIDTKNDLDFYLKHYEENPVDYAQKIIKMVQANLISLKINDGKMYYVRHGKTKFNLKCDRCWREGNGAGWIKDGAAHFMQDEKNIHLHCATEEELNDPYIKACMKNESEVKPEEERKTEWKLDEDDNDGRL